MYGPGHQFTSEHAILLHAHMQFIFYYRLCIISLTFWATLAKGNNCTFE